MVARPISARRNRPRSAKELTRGFHQNNRKPRARVPYGSFTRESEMRRSNTPLRKEGHILVVGAPRFELGTPSPPDWCANRAALRSERGGRPERLCPLAPMRKGGRNRAVFRFTPGNRSCPGCKSAWDGASMAGANWFGSALLKCRANCRAASLASSIAALLRSSSRRWAPPARRRSGPPLGSGKTCCRSATATRINQSYRDKRFYVLDSLWTIKHNTLATRSYRPDGPGIGPIRLIAGPLFGRANAPTVPESIC